MLKPFGDCVFHIFNIEVFGWYRFFETNSLPIKEPGIKKENSAEHAVQGNKGFLSTIVL